MKNWPIVSYARRYWWILVILYLGYIIMRSDSVFAVLDIFAYLPFVFAVWVSTVLLWRNIFNRNSTDKYVDEGGVAKDFAELTGREKVWYTLIQTSSYLIGGAIVTAAVVSNLFG